MAFTEFYCDASTGANINAGDLAANGIVTSTNGDWGNAAANRFTATSGTPFSGVGVGDFASVYLDGATTTVCVARVTAVNAGGASITLSTVSRMGTAPTNGATGRSCTTGGAWKGPNAAVGFPFNLMTDALTNVAGNPPRVNLKNGTNYSITSTISAANSSGSAFLTFQGYTSSPGDGGKAVIDGGTSGVSYNLLSCANVQLLFQDLILQNNGASGSADGVTTNSQSDLVFTGVVVNSVRGNGFFSNVGRAWFYECEAYACNQSNSSSSGGFKFTAQSHSVVNCVSHDNSGNAACGFVSTATAFFKSCIADTNGLHGFLSSGTGTTFNHCTAYNNTGSGISTSNPELLVVNCIFVSNGAYGISSSAAKCGLYNNAFYSNTSGQTNGVNASWIVGSITLSGDPFTAAATGNFTLNSTAGAGASCRAAGRGAFTETQASYTGSVSVPDVGACQVTDIGGGTTYVVVPVNRQVFDTIQDDIYYN